MNAEAKTLTAIIDRCHGVAAGTDDIYEVIDSLSGLRDRLSAPVEGVGLTRYTVFEEWGVPGLVEHPNGEWVRHDDAASAIAAKVDDRVRLTAALAAKEAERAKAEERAHYAEGTADLAMKHRDEAEAERDARKAALAPFAEALDEDDFADERLLDRDEIWEHPVAMRITFKHLRDAKRAALSPAQGGE